jgi:hypothetical protein
MSIPFEIANVAISRRSADSGPTKPEFDEGLQRTANNRKVSRPHGDMADRDPLEATVKLYIVYAQYAKDMPHAIG